jgi:crotonobetainyl-CoA:carnitine CoA-transferase CaiB-like acyl-CoA transferase
VAEQDPEEGARWPLEGVRVLSVEQYGAGPFATMLLADLGADVIKIEDPDEGDIGRYVPPFLGDRDSVYFQSLNRNKRSVALDLRDPAGRVAFEALVVASDAVFNNLRGDQPSRRGLDYATLKEINPAIVCAHLSGFGRKGPRTTEPGYDYLMQGYSGWMSITGEPDGPPQKSGLSLVDFSAGIAASLGLVSAILRAREGGIGCDIDVSLFDNAFSLLTYVGAWHLTGGYVPQRHADSAHPSQVPSQILPTKDGEMVIMCAKEKFFERLVTIMGRPDLATSERFHDFSTRLEHRDELIPILKGLSRERTTAEWLDLLRNNVPCAPVNTVPEALLDPQVSEAGLILEIDHPEFGSVRQIASAIRFNGSNSIGPRRGPRLGEHTTEVLRGLTDLSEAEVLAASAPSNGAARPEGRTPGTERGTTT